MSNLDELRKEADDLGITYAKTLGAEKLQKKIDDYYEAQETSGAEVEKAVAQKEAQSADIKDLSKAQRLAAKKIKMEAEARKTRIVTIIDNDQRENNNTTTCSANCSNEYFDLGTVILPLNEKVEVAEGHIKALAKARIPQHTKDPRTGLAVVKMRQRYTIASSGIQPK